MNDNSYEEYKRDLSRSNARKENSQRGKKQLILGAGFLVYLLIILPFHAGNVSEIRGDEVEAGRQYHRIHVYYIDNLQILHIKTNTDGSLYCIAKFLDCDGKEWVLCFTPGKDEELTDHIQLASSFETELNLTIKGYFQLRHLDELSSRMDSFYRMYAGKYADAEGSNLLSLNADYLCKGYENYTLAVLFRPGVTLVSLVAGLLSVIMGGFSVIRNRERKTG